MLLRPPGDGFRDAAPQTLDGGAGADVGLSAGRVLEVASDHRVVADVELLGGRSHAAHDRSVESHVATPRVHGTVHYAVQDHLAAAHDDVPGDMAAGEEVEGPAGGHHVVADMVRDRDFAAGDADVVADVPVDLDLASGDDDVLLDVADVDPPAGRDQVAAHVGAEVDGAAAGIHVVPQVDVRLLRRGDRRAPRQRDRRQRGGEARSLPGFHGSASFKERVRSGPQHGRAAGRAAKAPAAEPRQRADVTTT